MSNCIEFRNRVCLKAKHINIPAFQKYLEEQNKIKESNCWWFLVPGMNVTFYSNEVMICFGQGRSIHTNRDFRHTLKEISQFITCNVVCWFYFTDEGVDNTIFKEKVSLKNPNWRGAGLC